MKKKYDAVVTTGKYTDRDGKEKNRYLTVGAVLESDKGLSLKLEALPVGFNGWINFYEPKPKQDDGPAKSQEDEIPFN